MLDRRYALTATTDIHLTRVRLTATTDLVGLPVECSSAPGRGTTDTGAGAAGVQAITDAQGMVVAITAVEVITDAAVMVRAITDVQAMVDAVLHAVQGAATVAALAVGFTVEQVVSTVGVDMAAGIVNGLAS